MEEYNQYDPGGMSIEDLYARLIQLQSRISSTLSTVKREDGKIIEKQSQISQTVDEISLEVYYSDGTGEKVSRIQQNADNINLRVLSSNYNAETIASMINLAADRITISSQAIDLVGAVTVLSDITGNLGTITAGNIDIDEGIKVGTTVWLGQGFADTEPKSIYFNNDGWIMTSDQTFGINSTSELTFYAPERIFFNGSYIDFNNKPVTGLNVTVNFG